MGSSSLVSQEQEDKLQGIREMIVSQVDSGLASLVNRTESRLEGLTTKMTLRQEYLYSNMEMVLQSKEKLTFRQYIDLSLETLRRKDQEVAYYIQKGIEDAQRIVGTSNLGITVMVDRWIR